MPKIRVKATRLENISTFWQQRLDAAQTPAALVSVVFDRAKAAARIAEQAGDLDELKHIYEALNVWSHTIEKRHCA